MLRRGAARRGAYELLGVLGEYERREDQYHKDENHHDDADQGALHQHTHTQHTAYTYTHIHTAHTTQHAHTHTQHDPVSVHVAITDYQQR